MGGIVTAAAEGGAWGLVELEEEGLTRSAIGSATEHYTGAAVQVGSRPCLRADAMENAERKCSYLSLCLLFYSFLFFVLSMSLSYLSFFFLSLTLFPSSLSRGSLTVRSRFWNPRRVGPCWRH